MVKLNAIIIETNKLKDFSLPVGYFPAKMNVGNKTLAIILAANELEKAIDEGVTIQVSSTVAKLVKGFLADKYHQSIIEF